MSAVELGGPVTQPPELPTDSHVSVFHPLRPMWTYRTTTRTYAPDSHTHGGVLLCDCTAVESPCTLGHDEVQRRYARALMGLYAELPDFWQENYWKWREPVVWKSG